MKVSANSRTRFGQLAAAGLSATIFFYVAINLMMVMGLAPVVGVPLPLVSFGGSAVMTVMLCLGLLMALERQQRRLAGRLILFFDPRNGGDKAERGCAPSKPMLPAPPLKARKPPELPPYGSGRIAQLVEQLTLNQRVLGSSPSASTISHFDAYGRPLRRLTHVKDGNGRSRASR